MKKQFVKMSFLSVGLLMVVSSGCGYVSESETIRATGPMVTAEAGTEIPFEVSEVTPTTEVIGSVAEATPPEAPEVGEPQETPAAVDTDPAPVDAFKAPVSVIALNPEPVDAFETPVSVVDAHPTTYDAFKTPLSVIEPGPAPVDAFETPVSVIDARPAPVDAYETPLTLTEKS